MYWKTGFAGAGVTEESFVFTLVVKLKVQARVRHITIRSRSSIQILQLCKRSLLYRLVGDINADTNHAYLIKWHQRCQTFF